MNSTDKKYKELYKAHYPKVMRLCLGYVAGDEAIAKDLAQDIFIKIWENLDNFRNDSSISTWIYRISVNTCLSRLRTGKKRSRTIAIADVPEILEEHSDADREKQLVQLYKCIQKLSETNRAIILLVLEGLPQSEISEIIGLKHDAVRTRIHRIKSQLTKCVSHE
ncbi:RNA polymerase sigma factor [Maribacter chungangensis]|uniref:RNA polymerase sigma factor n=1 Tax=Maribacter chungangensis TaxID=1069117 RepID=A0ABW3AYE2_9FLAO